MPIKKVTHRELQDAYQVSGMSDELYTQLVDTLRYYDNMNGEKFKAPNLSQATNTHLVDELGEIRQEIKPRTTYEKVLSTRLKDKVGIPEDLGGFGELDKLKKHTFLGETYQAVFSWISKYIVDGDAIKAFGDDPIAFEAKLGHPITTSDFYKLSEYWEIRTTYRSTE